MERQSDFLDILNDSENQKCFFNWESFSNEKKECICEKLNITLSDAIFLHALLKSFDFRKETLPQDKVESALSETIWRLADRQVHYRGAGKRLNLLYSYFTRIAAILILPLIFYVLYSSLLNLRTEKEMNSSMITVTAQPGTISKVNLPDGTKVVLNSGSTISYPNEFAQNSRDVSLAGEAFFEVVKDPQKAMIVSAPNLKIKVYGTKFNVNAFRDADAEEVTLVEGKISLTTPSSGTNHDGEVFLHPGQMGQFNINTKKLSVAQVEPYYYSAWKDGVLVFHNAQFKDILHTLSRQFNVDIELKDKSLSTIPIEAKFKNERIDQILRLLSESSEFEFHFVDQPNSTNQSYPKSKIIIERKQ